MCAFRHDDAGVHINRGGSGDCRCRRHRHRCHHCRCRCHRTTNAGGDGEDRGATTSGSSSGHTSGRTDHHQVQWEVVLTTIRSDRRTYRPSPGPTCGIPRLPVTSVGRLCRAIGGVIHEPSVDGSHATIKQMMERGTRGMRQRDAMRRATTRRDDERRQRDAE